MKIVRFYFFIMSIWYILIGIGAFQPYFDAYFFKTVPILIDPSQLDQKTMVDENLFSISNVAQWIMRGLFSLGAYSFFFGIVPQRFLQFDLFEHGFTSNPYLPYLGFLSIILGFISFIAVLKIYARWSVCFLSIMSFLLLLIAIDNMFWEYPTGYTGVWDLFSFFPFLLVFSIWLALFSIYRNSQTRLNQIKN